MKFFSFAKKEPTVRVDEALIDEFLTRGVENLYPSADEVRKRLMSGKRLTIYTGVDPTGTSLHLGHGTVFRKLAKLQQLGHKVIVLIGNFTAKIGDPTDKMAARTQLTDEDVRHNMKDYILQLAPLIDFKDNTNPVEVRYNVDWLGKMNFADVVDLASHFTVQQMLERDMFAQRMHDGKPIYLHEFLYPLMQGYDSVYLDVDMEIGGNDQTFNMLAGRTLQKAMQGKDKLVMTTELLTDAEGKKMSKTDNNFVALADEPSDMFGKVMSWSDEMIGNAFRILTDVPMGEIDELLTDIKKGANPRDAKLRLAYEVVRIYKGPAYANHARDQFLAVFSKGEKPTNIETKRVSTRILADALVEAGMVGSKSEVRRLVEQKGLKVNDVVVQSYDVQLEKGVSLVQKGKRHFMNIEVK